MNSKETGPLRLALNPMQRPRAIGSLAGSLKFILPRGSRCHQHYFTAFTVLILKPLNQRSNPQTFKAKEPNCL